MNKFKACLSFISSIPASRYPSSTLSSFLFFFPPFCVFCVFDSISLECLDWWRLNLRTWSEHETFRNFWGWPKKDEMRITYTSDTDSLNFWLMLEDSRSIFPRQSTVNVSADISTEISADNRSIYRPSLGRYYRPSVGRYVDRHISRASVDMSTDASVESRSMCRPIYQSRAAQNTHDPNNIPHLICIGNHTTSNSVWKYSVLVGFSKCIKICNFSFLPKNWRVLIIFKQNERSRMIAFDEVERKPNFGLWLSRDGCPVHGYMLKKSTFL